MRELAQLAQEVSEIKRRLASMVRHGTVEQVDPKKHRVRLRLGEGADGTPFIGPWIPYAQIAGGLKVHTPPTVGQQMTTISPTGDFRQAVAVPLTWSDQNKSPSERGDENVLTYGNVKIELRDGQTKITVGDAMIDMTSGSIELAVGGAGFKLDGSKLQMTQKFVAKGGSRPAHYVTGLDSAGDAAVDGNPDVLI